MEKYNSLENFGKYSLSLLLAIPRINTVTKLHKEFNLSFNAVNFNLEPLFFYQLIKYSKIGRERILTLTLNGRYVLNNLVEIINILHEEKIKQEGVGKKWEK